MSGGLSVIPPGVSAQMLRAQPAWLRFRTRSSYSSGAPSVPGDFLSLPNGVQPNSGAVNLGLFTWGTNVSYPYLAAYGRGALVWTFQGVSTHRLNVVLPPWSGPAPLRSPATPASLIPSMAELRFVASLGWSGGSGFAGADIFSGFFFSDWNAFAIGSSGSPWPDISGNSYIGLIVNRSSGLTTVCMKRAGVAGRVVLATLSSLPADVAYTVDHRFTQATMFAPAFYSLRLNGQLVAQFTFSAANAPIYANAGDGIAPALFSSYWDTGGSSRSEHILSLDVLAGAGAHAFPIE